MALLLVAILSLQELARAARSAEKLLDTLNREIPPTLRDIRVTGKELSGLSDEVTGSMQSARSVVQQVDQGLSEARVQAKKAHITTRSFAAGAAAALRVLTGNSRRRRRPPTRRPPVSPLTPPSASMAKQPLAKPNASTPAQTSLETLTKEAVDLPVDLPNVDLARIDKTKATKAKTDKTKPESSTRSSERNSK